jgi:F0F1-type ATP synthase beta subunit
MAKTVTMSALLKRINRKLDGEVLKTARGERARSELGAYYAVNPDRNVITAQHVDPAEWAHELGVLKSSEKVEE